MIDFLAIHVLHTYQSLFMKKYRWIFEQFSGFFFWIMYSEIQRKYQQISRMSMRISFLCDYKNFFIVHREFSSFGYNINLPVGQHIQTYMSIFEQFVLGLTSLLNIWGHIAAEPACSSGTLTNVLPHRNAMTLDMTPHPVTVNRHRVDL